MFPVRPFRPVALLLLLGAVACTVRLIQPTPAAAPAGAKPDSAKRDVP